MNAQDKQEWKKWLKGLKGLTKKQKGEYLDQKLKHPDPMKELIRPKEKKNWQPKQEPMSIKEILKGGQNG
jgi:hypothetical protein